MGADRDGWLAYLVNQYPRTSHSFIRREILALEGNGVPVRRFSLRPLSEPLVEEADRRELEATRIVLDEGVGRHAAAVAAAALATPLAFLRTARLAVRLGRRSDRGVVRHLIYLAEAAVLVRWLRRDRVEHLHAHFGTNSAAVALLCRALGGPPYSFTVHGSEMERPDLLSLDEKIAKAAFAIAISSFGRAQICRWVREEDWPRVHVVHTGLGPDLLDEQPSPVPLAPRLVCVARLVRLKGHAVLLDAAARLAAEGVPFEIVLAGDGPERRHLEERVRRLGLAGKVHFAGWVSAAQVRDAIRAARALVLPSLSEGLPVVVMEALALGRPVIASALSAIPELVEPGVTGWLVPAGSPEHLTRAMREALSAAPDRLGEMGRVGVRLVSERHDASRQALRLLELFRGGLAETMRPRHAIDPVHT